VWNFFARRVSKSQLSGVGLAIIILAAITVFILFALPGWRQAGPATHRHHRKAIERRVESDRHQPSQ